MVNLLKRFLCRIGVHGPREHVRWEVSTGKIGRRVQCVWCGRGGIERYE